jgi:hypothetical protein
VVNATEPLGEYVPPETEPKSTEMLEFVNVPFVMMPPLEFVNDPLNVPPVM